MSTDVRQKYGLREFSLDDKYLKEEGTVILSGIQALVRLPIDQMRADRRAGLDTATLISGYRGSPLGGYDTLLKRNSKLLEEHQITLLTAVNEDLGATAVYGSQIANVLPDPKHDGVVGIWYGKAPGLDRSGDALKHANLVGTNPRGGVLAIVGDDPYAKSSTLPSHSEPAFYDAFIPVLYPGNISEVLSFGRYGIEMSRFSGLWVGMKVVTDVADGFGTAEVSPFEVIRPDIGQWVHEQNPTLLPHISLGLEKEMHEKRFRAAMLFARANSLNRITLSSKEDRIGIVSSGKTYYDVTEALDLVGINDVRLLKLGMIYPIDGEIVAEFADGLDLILVIEEKRGFIEMQLKEVLYGQEHRPVVIGKLDESGRPLVRAYSELLVDDVIEVLERTIGGEKFNKYRQRISKPVTSIDLGMAGPPRTPYFCSGCPHNTSTAVPEGSLAGAGIGCHGLTLLMERNTIGLLHMGAEGVPWVGAERFSRIPHMFQNMGDGTLAHSGYLAIRQAVAAGTNITYKILYNSVVAMTGGQHADGVLPIPQLVKALEAEGVSRVVVLTDDPKRHRGAVHRDRLMEVQMELREVKGVTVIIYDQPCAADLRRKRKRGRAPTPQKQVFINQMVCEGCGDCGVQSNCLSVHPVETEYGRKTTIHQSSCNRDYTCLKGDCPAFVEVEGGSAVPRPQLDTHELLDIPEPEVRVEEDARIYMVGIGGTGVVTINQILATAAYLDGKHSSNLDQTGLSQKGGSVISHIKLSSRPPQFSNRVTKAGASTMILFDVLAGVSDANLAMAHPDRTVCVVSTSRVPTGSMVRSKDVAYPEESHLLRRLEGNVKQRHCVDAVEIAEELFGSHLQSNMILLGAAYQCGGIPVSQDAIFRAIEINGVAVEQNKQAFLVGRMEISNPERLAALRAEEPEEVPSHPLLDGIPEQLHHVVAPRISQLIGFQGEKLAREYVEFVQQVVERDRDDLVLSTEVARYLYKLMAYKDEYEVARLYTDPGFKQSVEKTFGKGARITYRLHPPILRAMGKKSKSSFGPWFRTAFRVLAAMKFLRGTPLDIFGYTKVRRLERRLPREYMQTILEVIELLDGENYSTAVEIAQLPDVIRGYEEIKLRNHKVYEKRLQELMESIRG